MADPKTWTLVQAMKASLAVISQAAGYHTDLGATVTDEPGQVDQDATRAIGLAYLGSEPAKDAAIQRTHRLANVAVVAKVLATLDDAQIRLHEMVDDIERAMANQQANQARYPAGIQYPQYVKTEVIPPVEGAAWIGARVFYQSHYPKP